MSQNTTLHIAKCLDRLRLGERTAKQDLLAHAQGRLLRLTQKLFRDYEGIRRWEDADDVLQNSLVRLTKSLDTVSLETPRQFFRFAALQIRRELIDLVRRYRGRKGAARNQDSVASDFHPQHPDLHSDNDPARLAQWTELHEQLEKLSESEREVFELLWYHELSQEEAATVLEVSARTVKRRWQQVRLRLHEMLGNSARI